MTTEEKLAQLYKELEQARGNLEKAQAEEARVNANCLGYVLRNPYDLNPACRGDVLKAESNRKKAEYEILRIEREIKEAEKR